MLPNQHERISIDVASFIFFNKLHTNVCTYPSSFQDNWNKLCFLEMDATWATSYTNTTFKLPYTNYTYMLKYLFNTHSLEESLSFTNYEMDLQRTHVSRVDIHEYGCHSMLRKQAYKKTNLTSSHPRSRCLVCLSITYYMILTCIFPRLC